MKSLFIVTLFSTFFIASNGWAADGNGDLVTKKFLVEGMSCGGCEYGVKQKLKSIGFGDNIEKVSYEEGVAILKLKPSQMDKATECKVIKAINELEYTAYLDPKNKKPCE